MPTLTYTKAHKLFRSIHALSKKGIKNAQISRSLGIHRHTVEKYLAFKAPPQRRLFTKKVSVIAPYEDYILKRWKGDVTTPHRSTGRLQSRAILVPTRT